MSIAAFLAAMLSSIAIAQCPYPTGPAATRIVYDALEPNLVRAGPVSFGPEAAHLLSWLRNPSDPRFAEAALFELGERYGIDVTRNDRGEPLVPLDWADIARPEITAIGLAIVADDGALLSVGVYWKTPVFERIRLMRVDGAFTIEHVRDLPRIMGPIVSTCAVDVVEWVALSEEMARDLLEVSDEIWMLAFGPDDVTSSGPWSTWIPADQIENALRFDHPGIPATTSSYSAAFYGRGPSLRWTLFNAPRVSTTLGFGNLVSWIRGLFLR